MFNNFNSPVQSQDFLWLGEYADGTHLSEYDFNTQIESSFYAIDRQKLLRFGLVGHGMHLYYEVYGGVFKLAGKMIELIYKLDDKEYYLTGQQQMYRDIITYKDAEAILHTHGGGLSKSNITQYNFGYKQSLVIDGVRFNVKAICKIPFDQPAYLHISLVASKKLNGQLRIKRNGSFVVDMDAPLKPGVGGEMNWIIQ